MDAAGRDGALRPGHRATHGGAVRGDGWRVTDTDTGLATCVSLGNPSNVSGLVWNTDPSWLPTLTVTETDPGGMVFEGDVATFDVHAQWAGASWVTAGDGPWVPVVLPMTVYYDTIDPSGSAPADYQSTYGPRPVTLSVSFDGATDSWIADGTITVRTNGGIDDGVDGSVTVQLTHPFLCQLADNGQAMATVVRSGRDDQLARDALRRVRCVERCGHADRG